MDSVSIDPTEPMSAESVPGGTYIPQQAAVNVPKPASQPRRAPGSIMDKSMSDAAFGRASDVNDFDLTMRGIADGDPIGLETFDLGFFADGTPLIRINGANVPIRHEQWMSLLSARSSARRELSDRMEFAVKSKRARESVAKVTAAIPNLPIGMGEMLGQQAEIDPDAAITNLSRMYQAMMKDGAQSLMGDIGGELQAWKNDKSLGFMLRAGKERKEVRQNPADPRLPPVEVTIPGISKRDERVTQLRSSRNPQDAMTLLAYEKMEDFALDPNIRKAFPGLRIGIFDRIGKFEQDRYSPMSLFSRLQHLAAYNGGDFPMTVPLQHAGVVTPDASGQVNNAVAIAQYRAYLEQLDQFATALGYDLSSEESLNMMAIEMVGIATRSMQQAGQPSQQPQAMQPQQAPRSRPRATRG